jgi:hypothetical protein
MRQLDFIKSLTTKPVVTESRIVSYEDMLLSRLEHQANKISESQNPIDSVTLDIPLLIRLLEYAREDAKDDMDLHSVTERMILLSKSSETLSMSDYSHIVGEAIKQEPKKQDENIDVSMLKMLAGLKK